MYEWLVLGGLPCVEMGMSISLPSSCLNLLFEMISIFGAVLRQVDIDCRRRNHPQGTQESSSAGAN